MCMKKTKYLAYPAKNGVLNSLLYILKFMVAKSTLIFPLLLFQVLKYMWRMFFTQNPCIHFTKEALSFPGLGLAFHLPPKTQFDISFFDLKI